MMDYGETDVREAEELGPALHKLGSVKAPSRLLGSVLARVRLADEYFPLDTPIGPVFVAHNTRGISAIMRAEDSRAFENAFQARFGRTATLNPNAPAPLQHALSERLKGHGGDLQLDLASVSEFEQAVLRKALEIPHGEIRPYGWVAREIGRPRAVRAVGTALARNPIPLVIPCHRVVRSDGHIGNYGLGGPNSKLAILQSEGVKPEEIEELASARIRYIGSRTTKIYCFPTCRHARRISPQHRLPLRSEGEAVAAGFRPCKVCRPGGIAVGE